VVAAVDEEVVVAVDDVDLDVDTVDGAGDVPPKELKDGSFTPCLIFFVAGTSNSIPPNIDDIAAVGVGEVFCCCS